MQVSLAGAGLMGHGLGRNILKAGHGLKVLAHVKRANIDDLVGHGAREVQDIAALAQNVDVVLLCLPGSREVEAMVEKLAPLMAADSVIVDMSTSDPQSSAKLAKWLHGFGIGFADAPIAGGPEQALNGEVGLLVGAQADVFAKIKPLLSCFAARIAHMGEPSAGHAAKLVSNYLVTGMIALIADSFRVAKMADVKNDLLYEVMLAGSGNSGALRKMAGPAIQGDFDGYKFSLAHAAKDIRYFLKMAEGLKAASPLARDVEKFFAQAKAQNDETRNVSQLLQGYFE